MSRRMTLGVLLAVATSVLVPLHAQKKVQPPPDWPCIITFADTATDMIQSDGAGAYVNGQDGVQCLVRQSGGNAGNLFVNADRASTRGLRMLANFATTPVTTGSYAEFLNRQPGYFEITDVVSVLHGATGSNTAQARRVRVGVQGSDQFNLGEFWGDGLATDPLTAGTSSAAVTATGPCSWVVEWLPAPGRVVALREGIQKNRVRTGDFSLPFTAYVTVTAVKPGCPAR